MKMMKYMTSIATALFALVACSDADDILSAYHSDPNAVHITAEVGKASADGFTRSNPLGTSDEQKKFNDGDEISVTAGGQAAVTYRFDGSEWIPQNSKFLKWESESMTFMPTILLLLIVEALSLSLQHIPMRLRLLLPTI